jgi:glycosyltransferase involved in cell wall biosynthesis
VYAKALRRWYRRAYCEVDAVMSVVDPGVDVRRPSTLRLRLGLDPAFGPRADVERGEHVLYVGRLSREKGLRELLEAAACGAPVVTARTTPSAELLDGFVDTFGGGDASDLLLAIERSRAREPGLDAARALTDRHGWDAAIAAELEDMTRLVSRR